MSFTDSIKTRAEMLDAAKSHGSGEVFDSQDYRNLIFNAMSPQVDISTVDMSAGGTAQTAAVFTVPANSIIQNIVAVVTTAADGDTTQTLEVGITGNIDKYIDTVDFDPSATAGTSAAMISGTTNDQKIAEFAVAAVPLIATWTNTASATAGVTTIYTFYFNID